MVSDELGEVVAAQRVPLLALPLRRQGPQRHVPAQHLGGQPHITSIKGLESLPPLKSEGVHLN